MLPRSLVAKKVSLPLRRVSAGSIADGFTMTRKRAEKARQAATEQLSRAYDLLGEDMPEADVGDLLEAQVETVYEKPYRPTRTASRES